jgi:iron(III) transport system substrate-binding protein
VSKSRKWSLFGLSPTFALLTAVLLGACGGNAPAAATTPSSPADVFQYSGADRQQQLEAGAKKEGKLLFYASLTLDTRARPLADAFQKKYSFVHVDIVQLFGLELRKRVLEEYQANRHDVDVMEADVLSTLDMKDAKILAKYSSPAATNIPTKLRDPDGQFMADREIPLVVSYNTNSVKESDVPKTYDDLLSPNWVGKLTTSAGGLLVPWTGAMLKIKGEDFIRKLAAQKVSVQSIPPAAVIGLVGSGEVTMMFPASLGDTLALKKKGGPVNWIAPGPIPTNLGYDSLAVAAPHPNAAALFIDWLRSDEGQAAMAATGEGATGTSTVNSYSDFKLDRFYTDFSVPQDQYRAEFTKWDQLSSSLFVTSK